MSRPAPAPLKDRGDGEQGAPGPGDGEQGISDDRVPYAPSAPSSASPEPGAGGRRKRSNA